MGWAGWDWGKISSSFCFFIWPTSSLYDWPSARAERRGCSGVVANARKACRPFSIGKCKTERKSSFPVVAGFIKLGGLKIFLRRNSSQQTKYLRKRSPRFWGNSDEEFDLQPWSQRWEERGSGWTLTDRQRGIFFRWLNDWWFGRDSAMTEGKGKLMGSHNCFLRKPSAPSAAS
jgi:hypothetical protein